MQLRPSTLQDIPDIIEIANITWPHTYSSIITADQIHYMLKLFYNTETITEQMNSTNHYFVIAENEMQNVVGYAHVYLQDDNVCKLSKLYVLPTDHGKQFGKKLLKNIENFARIKKCNCVILNVNRFNIAKDFYLKNDYKIIEFIDIPLDKFWLNDYILEKRLD